MNPSRSNNTIMDNGSGSVKPSKVCEGTVFKTSSNKVHPNLAMRSFFQQLAREKCVRSFSLVSDNASLPRCNMKRHSAPPVINGATREMLSTDEAPSCPVRRSSSRDFSEYSSNLFMETIFNEALETLLDKGDGILYDVDECEEDDGDQSIDSQPSVTAPLHAEQEEPDFDSTFQRFTVDPPGDESPETSTRSSPSWREQAVAPKLPVRKESMELFSSPSSGSISTTSLMNDSVFEVTSMSASRRNIPPLPPPESPDAVTWQHQGKVLGHHQCPTSATTASYVMDMKDMNGVTNKSSKYGRRRRSPRRSSLDTGVTFRNSFSSQENSEEEDISLRIIQ